MSGGAGMLLVYKWNSFVNNCSLNQFDHEISCMYSGNSSGDYRSIGAGTGHAGAISAADSTKGKPGPDYRTGNEA